MNKLIAWAQSAQKSAIAFWRSLPIPLQTWILVFASAAGTFLTNWLRSGPSCWTWVCLKGTLGAAVAAGIAAERLFKMRPGPGPHAGETVYKDPSAGIVNDDGRDDPQVTSSSPVPNKLNDPSTIHPPSSTVAEKSNS
jgi:hypothetical protein